MCLIDSTRLTTTLTCLSCSSHYTKALTYKWLLLLALYNGVITSEKQSKACGVLWKPYSPQVRFLLSHK